MRIGLLIPDGVGIRNYLYTDVLKHLYNQGHEVVVWHALPDEVIEIAKQLHDITIKSVAFKATPEPTLARLYREATTYARLKINARNKNNPTILTNWSNKRNTVGKKILYPLAEIIGGRLKNLKAIEKWEQKIESQILKSQAFNNYRNQLEQMHIDVLFCTHQRVPAMLPVILAAKSLGIKTATSIFSWDNLPKARLPFRADHYFVWSDYMKDELLSYYPDIEAKSIAITGTPQFDFYQKDSLLISREEFAAKYGLDSNKKWVCFSGDDIKTSPYDSDYLKDVAQALNDDSSIQVLFRQVPTETVTRYQAIIDECSNIKHIAPEWQKGKNWGSYYPLYSDVGLLINLAKHCHAVINIGSTMAFDFSKFNTPALFINYDQQHAQNWSVETIYNYQHFRSMQGLDPVGWINSKEEIKEKVELAIDQPNKVGIDKHKWFTRVVSVKETSAAQRIVNGLTA